MSTEGLSDSVGIVVLGHGSRDPRANAEFGQLVESYRAARPTLIVEPAFIELAEPSLTAALDAMAARARRVVVAPVFLFAAGHVKNDIPLALSRARVAHPLVNFTAAAPLGVHANLAAVAYDRIAQVLEGAPLEPRAPNAVISPAVAAPADGDAAAATKTRGGVAVIVVGRGASDPDANGDFVKMVRLIGEGRGFAQVEPAFIGITKPSVDEALERVSRSRPPRIILAPYFLYAGRLLEKLGEIARAFVARQPWIRVDVAPHLGGGQNDPRIFEILDERVQGALTGAGVLPCDTCLYRQDALGYATQIGGLKAMLYSVRHMMTHEQATPHVHAHRPIHKHVLVCTNTDCAERGSLKLVDALRRELRDAGVAQTVRVTKTSCMGRCGEGPTVVVYPDGVWYRGVAPTDARSVVRDHLVGDRLVGPLVDSIMH